MRFIQKKQTQSNAERQTSAPGSKTEDMAVEGRIEAADARKIEGNAFFKDGKLEEAMQQYQKALDYLRNDYMAQLAENYREMALAVKNPCHLNMAACLLKLKRYDEAVVQCSVVLAQDENSVKALYRRGKARAELGQTDAAREDFFKARKLAPEDKAITNELRLLAEHEKAVYEKQKELYKGIFGPKLDANAQTKRDDNNAFQGSNNFTPKVNLTRRASRGKYSDSAGYNDYSDHW